MSAARTKITILVDNQAPHGLIGEHGLALWIETADRRILFDTGQGQALTINAEVLGIDLAETTTIVLSHGHYDHTGGLPQVLQRARHAEVLCHPGVLLSRYSVTTDNPKSIELPPESAAALETLPEEQVHWVQQPVFLSDGIGLTGPVSRETSYEDTGGPFYLDPQGTSADPIEDDLALWMRTGEGLVVCVGCAHAGLVNTLNQVKRLNHGLKLRAVIGGFHLRSAGRKRLERTVAALRMFEPKLLVPCHCTGDRAVAELYRGLGDRVSAGAAGMTWQF